MDGLGTIATSPHHRGGERSGNLGIEFATNTSVGSIKLTKAGEMARKTKQTLQPRPQPQQFKCILIMFKTVPRTCFKKKLAN